MVIDKAVDISRHRFGASMFAALSAAGAASLPQQQHSATTAPYFHYDRQLVSIRETGDGRVVLKPGGKLPFGRARECPRLNSLSCPTTTTKFPAATHRHVSLAAAGLVNSENHRVLLTRRPSWMRIFPGAWVLPGGKVDGGETLSEAVVREIREETGICHCDVVKPLCLWESVYPTDGIPMIRSHHLVVYFLLETNEESTCKMVLEESEVDSAVWLDHGELKAIVDATLRDESLDVVKPGSRGEAISLTDLVGIYPARPTGTGGVAQGSLFALQEFIISNGEVSP